MITKMKVKVRNRMDCTTTFRRTIAPVDDITLRCNHSTSHIPAIRGQRAPASSPRQGRKNWRSPRDWASPAKFSSFHDSSAMQILRSATGLGRRRWGAKQIFLDLQDHPPPRTHHKEQTDELILQTVGWIQSNR